MKNLALIGAGQLGSRHLQALAKIQTPIFLNIVEPNQDATKLAYKRYLELAPNKNIRGLTFTSSLDQLNHHIDLCIIATNSDVRFKILQDILSRKEVNYLLLEKVVFQSEREFNDAGFLLEEKKIKCWVNCPRRTYSFYQEFKRYFNRSDKLHYEVTGGDWGVGCNAIHHIDHLAYYTNDTDYKVDINGLDLCVHQSKRKGFVEFTGNLELFFSRGSSMKLTSIANSDEPKLITIESPETKIVIDESRGVAKLYTEDKSRIGEEIKFNVPYQSELTHLAAAEILRNGTCPLTSFDESAALHIPLIQALIKHLEKVENRSVEFCPIT